MPFQQQQNICIMVYKISSMDSKPKCFYNSESKTNKFKKIEKINLDSTI